jgi:SsrA-binding protein
VSAQKKDPRRYSEIRNSRALHDYSIGQKFEAGIQLLGTEVKSIRNGRAQISEAFGRPEKGELWLFNAHIDPYTFGNINNHDARRPRKLLLHKHQLLRIAEALAAGGRTLIPLRLYFKEALIKVEVAICTGKKLFDKRDDLKKKVQMRDIEKALRHRRG